MTLLLFRKLSMTESMIMLVALILILLAYLKLCDMVGRYAQRRGQSYWLFYLIALFCNPFVGYIIAVLAGDDR